MAHHNDASPSNDHVRRSLRWPHRLAWRNPQSVAGHRANDPVDQLPVSEGMILIVHLDGWTGEFLAHMLRDLGFETLVVEGQTQALDVLAQENPDMLVVVGPPDSHLYEALRRASPIPMLALAPKADHEQMVSAYVAGVDQFQTGPISDYEAVARVRALLRQAARAARMATRPACPPTNGCIQEW